MPSVSLNSIEWHDLAVSTLSITDCGFELGVMPWIETTGDHAPYTLQITDAENVKFNVNGALSREDFANLEISEFQYTFGTNERMSGTVSILPGRGGFWTISFFNAIWSFEQA